MVKRKGYTDENGEYHKPMSRAEARASAQDMKKMMACMEGRRSHCKCACSTCAFCGKEKSGKEPKA